MIEVFTAFLLLPLPFRLAIGAFCIILGLALFRGFFIVIEFIKGWF